MLKIGLKCLFLEVPESRNRPVSLCTDCQHVLMEIKVYCQVGVFLMQMFLAKIQNKLGFKTITGRFEDLGSQLIYDDTDWLSLIKMSSYVAPV